MVVGGGCDDDDDDGDMLRAWAGGNGSGVTVLAWLLVSMYICTYYLIIGTNAAGLLDP